VYLADFVNFFKAKIEQSSINQAVNKYFPLVMEGMSGHVLHSIIQIGWMIGVSNKLGVAGGLGLACYGYLSLGPVQRIEGSKEPLSILQAVSSDPIFENFRVSNVSKFRHIVQKLSKAPFRAALEKYDIPLDSNADINELLRLFCKTVVQIFFCTGCCNFFLLHGITSMRGLQMILPLLSDKTIQLDAFRFFWKALVAVYVATGRKPLNCQPRLTQLSWEEIISKTLQERFEEQAHLPKLVYSCLEFDRLFGPDQLFRQTAAGALSFLLEHRDWDYYCS